MAYRYNHEHLPGNALTRTLALGAFLVSTAVAVEKIATDEEHKKLSPEAKVVSNIREGDKAIYVLPGCRTNGHYIGSMLDPLLAEQGSTHHLAHPEKGFSLESVKNALLDARALDGDRPATIYASSMGGMVMSSLLMDPEFRERFGRIDKVIFDSSPADSEDLDGGTRKAMTVASIIPPSWTVAHLYRAVTRRSYGHKYKVHSADITDEQAYGHGQSSANTHLSAVEGQANFIDHTRFDEGQLRDAYADVGNIVYIGSSIDHTVNQEVAHQKYARAMGRSVLRVIDWDREEGSHASGPEFPRFVADIIAQKYDKESTLGTEASQPSAA